MPFVQANPNQYLITGRAGRLVNRGSAVRTYLLPGSVWVLVPGSKQEAAFEFTQETRDGIPLRFKGLVIYRITDPTAAAGQFDFTARTGIERINDLLTHVALGELRHAVSHMTMVECIEQRKTTLTGVVATALDDTLRSEGAGWGLTVEVAQVAQVYIVDTELRRQLEAEVRNDIRRKSDQSDLETTEAAQLAGIASTGRVQEQRLAAEREQLRRDEALRLAEIERDRRLHAEAVATAQRELELELERFRTEMSAERSRAEAEAPVRLLRIRTETEALREELALRELRARVAALQVEEALARPRAEQAMRAQILPFEQAPAIVESASHVLQGTTLSMYGEGAELIGQLAPVLGVLSEAVRRSTTPAAASQSSAT